ncbi:MAG: hypothetical protein PHE24_06890 [Patescibacteria group bacterium]|nr:hypothetical protein [Patescibacteria group bacterium]
MASDNNIQVSVEDIPTSLKNVLPEDQGAAQRAYDEFTAITLGKKEMTMKELYELKLYAKKRTDIEKSDDQLTPDQVVWKTIHGSIEKMLVEHMKPEEKENLDNLQNEMDSLDQLAHSAGKIMPLGQEIETEIIMQRAALTVYFDKGVENEYKTVVDGVTTDLVDPKKWSPSERIEKAETVLKIIDANREYLYKKQLMERHETIHRKLRDFEKIYHDIDSAVVKNQKVLENDPGLSKLLNTTKEWIHFTKDLYTSRTHAISAVKNSIDLDEFLPKLVLEKKGDVSGNISTSEPFFEQMAAVAVLLNKANEEEEDLAKKRDPLSEELFGKPESYMEFPKENEASSKTTKINQSGGMSKKTKWFIVIALSVVALSWGIWTAIGVFVLGLIIINVLSK